MIGGVVRSGQHARRMRAYTVVELMMALALFAVGITGLVAMQRVVVEANTHARDVAVANRIAAAWLDQLRVDAAVWNHPSAMNGPIATPSDINQTQWLRFAVAPGVAIGWIRPAYVDTRDWGGAFDAVGRPIPTSATGVAAEPRFCAHLQLAYLSNPARMGDGRIRATVRVFWRRAASDQTATFCAADAATVTSISDPARLTDFHYVFDTTVISQQTARSR